MASKVNRTDLCRLDAVERTASGDLRVPGRLARTGVLTYDNGAGDTWGELVPEETLFDAASMATARGIALVDLHPGGLVTPATRKGLAVGHVGDDVQREGAYLTATVYVTDAAEIALVEQEERRDLSCGYTCDLDETPGVFEGQPYRAIQRNRVYNHLGLGPEGWGRAGTDVSLRLDGGGAVARVDFTGGTSPSDKEGRMATRTTRKDEGPAAAAGPSEPEKKADEDVAEEMVPKKDADAAYAALEAKHVAMVEALEGKLAEMAKVLAELKAGEQAEVTEADVPEAVADSIVAKRLAKLDTTRESARLVAPGVKLDGLTSVKAVQAAVIASALPTVKLDGLTDAGLEGMFLGLVEGARAKGARRADGDRRLSEVLAPSEGQAEDVKREDGGAEEPVVIQRAKLTEWGKAPLNGRV